MQQCITKLEVPLMGPELRFLQWSARIAAQRYWRTQTVFHRPLFEASVLLRLWR